MHTAHPTPYAELNDVLQQLVTAIQTTLTDNLIGIYLQGSFAIGDFDPFSDCDFIVVIDHDLSDAQVTALQTIHARIFDLDLGWAKHLEGSYFPKAVLRDYKTSGGNLWYLDHGSRSLVLDSHCNTVLVRWAVRDFGVALLGPSPDTLVDPIPVDSLRRHIAAVMRDWGQDILAHPEAYNNRFYQTYIVHNFSRMLHDLTRGYPGSKRAGTAWVKATLDPKWIDLIERSWMGRTDAAIAVRTPADPNDLQSTLAFVRYIIAETEARGFFKNL